jgi:regulator of sirC expression with transglutaminase-like and TPR domain
LGWQVDGLMFPHYMLCRIEQNGVRLVFDPAQQCRLMAAHDLRALVKKTLGPHAEISVAYSQELSRREILIHLQNQIKLRYIEMGEYPKALSVVSQMRALDPQEYRLLLDAGVLYAKTNNAIAAVRALEDYIAQVPSGRDRQEALALLHEIKSGLVV